MRTYLLTCLLLMAITAAVAQPKGDRVVFYQHNNYAGLSREAGPGSFGSALLGVLSGQISSVYIPTGYTIAIYDRQGRKNTINRSIPNLGVYGWDNRITSGLIRTGSPSGGGVKPPGGGSSGGQHGSNAPVRLYYNTNFKGNTVPCNIGLIQYIGAGADKSISSIYIAKGYVVTVYDKRGHKGRSHTFLSSVPSLAAFGWDNRVASVIVSRQD
ncbi:hypothetical protein ACWKWU_03900 [Chitinophaga lutea]